ncbi:hypothetical protein GCM10009844_22520 [Nocardioides koreensis]|uniref:Uncharacterized protein n=1 Tax=Nocardioides koreensis TaxID=433651 RepID=A0ABP5LFN6_9ACTN
MSRVQSDGPENPETRLFVWLVLVGLLVFATAVAVGGVLGGVPGTLADWVGAVSTFAALLAAGYAAVQTRRTFVLEQRRDAARDEDVRRGQAVLVAVWAGEMEWVGPRISSTFVPGSSLPVTTRGQGVVYPTSIPVTVQNASQVPIYHLRVEVFVGPSASTAVPGAACEVSDRATGVAVLGLTGPIEIVSPKFVGDLTPALESLPDAAKRPPGLYLGWSFQDNAGQWWRRLPTGDLVRLSAAPGDFRSDGSTTAVDRASGAVALSGGLVN